MNLSFSDSFRHAGPRSTRWASIVFLCLTMASGVVRADDALADESVGAGPGTVVLVTDLANSTGNPLLDGSLRLAVSIGLAQSPMLNVQQASATASAAGSPGGDASVAAKPCDPKRAKAIVGGSVTSVHERLQIELRATSCADGTRLARAQSEAPMGELLQVLGAAVREIRSQLGEPASTLQRFDVPLSQAGSASLEALQAMSAAVDAEAARGASAALPMLERAIALDPQFGPAIARAGKIYRNLGQEGRAVELMTRAFAVRARVTQRDRYLIETDYYSFVTGEYEQGVADYLAWIRDYPRDFRPHVNLGSLYGDLAQYRNATREFLAALSLEPRNLTANEDLLEISMLDDHFEVAHRAYDRMRRLELDDDSPHLEMYAIDFLEHDPAAMAREIAWFEDKPLYQHEMLAQQADSAAYSGHLAEARALTARAVDAALQVQNREQAAGWLLNSAWREEVFGNHTAAGDLAARALALVPDSRENAAVAAVVLARTGDVTKAQRIERDLSNRYRLNVSMQRYWLPCIRAQIALSAHQFAAALQELQVTRPHDALYPQVTNSSHAFSVALRADAYRGLGEEQAAREQWEWIVKHPGPVSLSATAPLARLEIARSYALEPRAGGIRRGRNGAPTARRLASAAYEQFFSLWKDADPEIPLLRQARSEYATLRSSGGHGI